jgi:hypothetical protein
MNSISQQKYSDSEYDVSFLKYIQFRKKQKQLVAQLLTWQGHCSSNWHHTNNKGENYDDERIIRSANRSWS